MRGIEGLQELGEGTIPVRADRGPAGAPPLAPAAPGRELDVDERAARRALRRQVARLEQQLSVAIVDDLQAGARGRLRTDVAGAETDGAARLLGLGDLERRRDELVARLTEVEARRTEELHNRVLLREMYRDPAAYKHARVETSELAERGCRVYEVVPRFGLVGILGGWWRVKVSSGCPLAPAGRASSSAGGDARSIDGRPAGRPSCARGRTSGRHLGAPGAETSGGFRLGRSRGAVGGPAGPAGVSPAAAGRRTRGMGSPRSSRAGRGRRGPAAARDRPGRGSTPGCRPGPA